MPTLVKCPVCRADAPWADNPHRPFCSERCRYLDLGAWAEGKYRIAGDDPEDESESRPADDPDRR